MMNKSLRLATVPPTQSSQRLPEQTSTGANVSYSQNAFERWVLFLDTLHERFDNMIRHQRQGMRPFLDFENELLLDARTFDRHANYALLRITRVGEDCPEDSVDETKPPVIVIDPRVAQTLMANS